MPCIRRLYSIRKIARRFPRRIQKRKNFRYAVFSHVNLPEANVVSTAPGVSAPGRYAYYRRTDGRKAIAVQGKYFYLKSLTAIQALVH